MSSAGFNIAQVVHDYGDIRQTMIDIAIEEHAPITVEETRRACLCDCEQVDVAVFQASRRIRTTAVIAPSNSGSVQINAVAIRRSDAMSHIRRNPRWVTGLGKTDINSPRALGV